jgi:hypothetical protein
MTILTDEFIVSQIVSDSAQLRTFCYIHEEEETTLWKKPFFSSHQKILFPRIDNPAVDIPGQVRNTCKSTGKEKEKTTDAALKRYT